MTLADVPREGESLYRNARPDYRIDPESGCWVWLKSLLRGYPVGGGAIKKPHRAYYELAHGPVPKGWHVHHKCENERCVNPEHLAAISERDHHLLHFMLERGYSLDLIRRVRAEGRKAGASYREVARRYGMHFNTVYRWWNAISWADLLDDGPVVTPGNVCALPGCDNVCQGRRHKRFCCSEHRDRAKSRRQWERRKASVDPNQEEGRAS
jgi:hypothetical protein